MIAGRRHDDCTGGSNVLETPVAHTNSVRTGDGAIVDVTGHDDDVDCILGHRACDRGENALLIGQQVDTVKRAPDVPIRGVQNSHVTDANGDHRQTRSASSAWRRRVRDKAVYARQTIVSVPPCTMAGMTVVTGVGLAAAFVLGAVFGWILRTTRGNDRLARAEERLAAVSENEDTLRRSLGLLSEDSARRHSGAIGAQVSSTVEPLREALDSLTEHVRAVEHDRVHAYAGLSEQVAAMQRASQQLSSQTSQLVTALRAPQVRGRWGEIQLERVVELSGMTRHCDFDTQVARNGVRPDLVVRLAGGKQIVLDAKVPLVAFLDAAAEDDPDSIDRHLVRHARHLRTHVDQLADKEYWRSFEPTPEFVVLFVPGDTFLDAALSRDSGLLEHAFGRGVILATPTTLVALLRTVAYTWKQDALAQDAAVVQRLGRELYERLGSVAGHVDKLGAQLGKAVESFNSAAGSLESRVFVTARKLHEMDLYTGTVPEIATLDIRPRAMTGAADSVLDGHATGAT